MLLVPRDILLDVASKAHPLSLSENESSAFDFFCQKANTCFKDISATTNRDSTMEAFSDKMLDYLKSNVSSIRFVGQGSSRMVFAMADNTALKLAKSYAGIAQNKQEAKICLDSSLKFSIFPDFYGADRNNYLALNCELCSPAKKEDFKELFNCQPSVITNVIGLIIQAKLEDWELSKLILHYDNLDMPIYSAFVQKLIDNDSTAFQAIRSLIDFYRKYGLDELLLGDVEEIDNWGITFRDGQKTLLIIDAGFNSAIHKQYYASKLKSEKDF